MKERKDAEWLLANRLLDDLLAAGFIVTVNDGEEECLVNSTDKAAILEAMASTDEDYLHVIKSTGKDTFLKGWVRMIYGNEIDLISDYTTNLEPYLAGVNKFVDDLDDRGGIVKKPITILDVAKAKGAKEDKDGSINAGEFARLGLPFFAGCQHCHATLVPYNAHPTRNGLITGSCCIDPKSGFASVADYDAWEAITDEGVEVVEAIEAGDY